MLNCPYKNKCGSESLKVCKVNYERCIIYQRRIIIDKKETKQIRKGLDTLFKEDMTDY